MPPATPSPHRFLSGQRKTQTSPREPRPQSTLRSEVVRTSFEDDIYAQPSQFAPTPRFSHHRLTAIIPSQRPASPEKPSLAEALRASFRHAEDVEDASTEDDDMLDLEQEQARETTEREPTLERPHDLALSPKRRRLSHGEVFSSQRQSGLDNMRPTTSHGTTNEISRFTQSFAQATQSSPTVENISTQSMGTQRPAFIRPPAQPQEPSEPLPEAFSPHRRGPKFVPGGMAAIVQQWVLETGQAAIQSRKGQGQMRGDDYVVRVKTEDKVEGIGPLFVSTKLSNGDSIDVLLAGDRSANRIDPGSVVGIRAPTWEVNINEKAWTVGVDWRVLS